MIDRWIESYEPTRVIDALAPVLTEERRARIDEVIASRLASVTVVLENLHDPHNGAAALRSVEGFGLCALHVVEQAESFRFSPKVTQGCEKWVALRRYRDFAPAAGALRDRGFALLAAVPGAGRALEEIDVSLPVALVFGNEHAGLSPAAHAACDGSFGIPLHGFTRSFNLSVSVAMSVHDCARRRRAHLGRSGDLSEEERLRLRARFYALSLDERTAEALVRA